MLFLISSFLIIVGLLNVFAKDFVWERTKAANRAEGIASERTASWETMTTVSGIIFIIAGFITLVISFNGQ